MVQRHRFVAATSLRWVNKATKKPGTALGSAASRCTPRVLHAPQHVKGGVGAASAGAAARRLRLLTHCWPVTRRTSHPADLRGHGPAAGLLAEPGIAPQAAASPPGTGSWRGAVGVPVPPSSAFSNGSPRFQHVTGYVLHQHSRWNENI